MRLKRKNHSVPELNMAAMPDLIFTVLFFFMIAAHIRPNVMSVSAQLPEGMALQKVTNKAAVIHVYVGRDLKTGDFEVQIGDRITPYSALADAMRNEREQLPASVLENAVVSMQADKDVPMYIINKVKMALREAKVLKINYNGNETISQPTR